MLGCSDLLVGSLFERHTYSCRSFLFSFYMYIILYSVYRLYLSFSLSLSPDIGCRMNDQLKIKTVFRPNLFSCFLPWELGLIFLYFNYSKPLWCVWFNIQMNFSQIIFLFDLIVNTSNNIYTHTYSNLTTKHIRDFFFSYLFIIKCKSKVYYKV